jgi:hypothetical protein
MTAERNPEITVDNYELFEIISLLVEIMNGNRCNY